MPLATTARSVGYKDDYLDDVGWYQIYRLAGSDQSLLSGTTSTWKVTPGGSGRTLSIAAGIGFSGGVLDVTVDAETRSSTALASGTLRYDTLVMRHSYTTQTSDFVVLAGGATAVPSSLVRSTPGDVDDYILGLVKVTTATVVEFIDWRTWESKDVTTAATAAVRKPQLGQVARLLSGGLQRWMPDGSGGFAWRAIPGGSPAYTAQTGSQNLASVAQYFDLATATIDGPGTYLVSLTGSLEWSIGNTLGFATTVRSVILRLITGGGTILRDTPIDLTLTKGQTTFAVSVPFPFDRATPLVARAAWTGPSSGVVGVSQSVLRADVA